MPRSFLSNVRFGADQAIIAESVTTGGGRSIASPTLLAASSGAPMPILEEIKTA